MIGSIAGDIIGSVYEFCPVKTKQFDLFTENSVFTDDTVCTIAVADHILNGGGYAAKLKQHGRRYPGAGWGGRFYEWLFGGSNKPYNSYGNGSAMRVSPVGFAFNTLNKVLEEAKISAEVTHNHPEGIKGAQAVAAAIFLARHKKTKEEIRSYIQETFEYDLRQTVDQIRPNYEFHETCQESVPQSIICFLDSTDYEDAVRNAISLGGDADTMACIAGGIAQAYYGTIPEYIIDETCKRLDPVLFDIWSQFDAKFKTL